MPEHLHFVIFITEATDTHLGDIILDLKGECTRRYRGTTKQTDREAPLVSIFEEGYHDRILLKEGQLQRMLAYVSDNGFGTNYTPKGLLHTLCSEGRLLIIAPTEHRTASMALDRATCLQMNALAETVAAYSLRRL